MDLSRANHVKPVQFLCRTDELVNKNQAVDRMCVDF